MISPRAIRKFLLQQPRAAVIRLSRGEDETSDLVVSKSQSWSKVAASVHAIQPTLIELLDAKGQVIRALRPEEELTRSDAAPIPAALASDPETVRLTHFADLLHRAYEHSTEIAFQKLLELVELLGQRADAIESRLERAEVAYRRAMQNQLDDAFGRAEELAELANSDSEEGATKDQVLGALLTRMMAQHPGPGPGVRKPPNNGNGRQ